MVALATLMGIICDGTAGMCSVHQAWQRAEVNERIGSEKPVDLSQAQVVVPVDACAGAGDTDMAVTHDAVAVLTF